MFVLNVEFFQHDIASMKNSSWFHGTFIILLSTVFVERNVYMYLHIINIILKKVYVFLLEICNGMNTCNMFVERSVCNTCTMFYHIWELQWFRLNFNKLYIYLFYLSEWWKVLTFFCHTSSHCLRYMMHANHSMDLRCKLV